VTAYARLELYKYLCTCEPIYCDTDSIITKHDLPVSSKLGELKKEMTIKQGIIIKPKFYALQSVYENEKDKVKIKGVPSKIFANENDKILGIYSKLNYEIFNALMTNNKIEYEKFVKFKESLRRGLDCNSIIETSKVLNLKDTKRVWDIRMNLKFLNDSEPIDMNMLDSDCLKPCIFTQEQIENLCPETLIEND